MRVCITNVLSCFDVKSRIFSFNDGKNPSIAQQRKDDDDGGDTQGNEKERILNQALFKYIYISVYK